MKKFIMLFVTVLALAVTSLNAQSVHIMVKNGPKAEIFAANDIALACSAAADGDTLFFSKGRFVIPSNFTITKKLALIGSGYDTKLDGSITVKISGVHQLTFKMFSCLQITGTLSISSELDGLVLYKVALKEFAIPSGTVLHNCRIDRCNINYFQGSNERNINCVINNSIISNAYGACSKVYFDYCYLGHINYNDNGSFGSNIFYANVDNSILFGYYSSSHKKIVGGELCYCMYNDVFDLSDVVIENSYKCSTATLNSFQFDSLSRSTELITGGNEYFSSDGVTPVGPFGGLTPLDPDFSPTGPEISEFQIQTDLEKKELRVKLTIQTK